jgi:hypothetical protein
MIRKGILSKINLSNNTASVVFKELNGTVSAELPIASETMFSVGDVIVAVFFGNDFSDGAIIAKIGGG